MAVVMDNIVYDQGKDIDTDNVELPANHCTLWHWRESR